MKIELVRDKMQRTGNATEGALIFDGVLICHTLEDRYREIKVKGDTCIPVGTYQVLMTLSQRFQRVMPLLIAVPNFSGIRIHAGNKTADTEGCILVGERSTIPGELKYGTSKAAKDKVYELIQKAVDRKEVVEIVIYYQT